MSSVPAPVDVASILDRFNLRVSRENATQIVISHLPGTVGPVERDDLIRALSAVTSKKIVFTSF